MNQAFLALLGAAATVAACYSTGALILDRTRVTLARYERYPLSFLLGAACLHLALFALLALNIAYWPVVLAVAAGSIGAAIWTGSWRLKGAPGAALSRIQKLLFGLCFGAFTYLYFFNALAPETSPDGSGYHLALTGRYMRTHGFGKITTSIFASLSQGVDLLFLPAYIIGRHSAAALVHFSFAIALALSVFAFGRRIGKPWVGAAAAILTYASPVVGIDGTSAYNDVGVAAIVFAAFYWVEIWDEQRSYILLILSGLMAGYAYAAKYTAFLILPYALGLVLLRTRKLLPVCVLLGSSLVMVAPWMIKNWVTVENPIAPLGNRLFRNPAAHVMFEQELAGFMQRYTVANRWTLPLEVTVRGQNTVGLIGPVFLALPLALLALRFAVGRRLLTAGLLLLSTYYFNIGTRFLIPALPFFSLSIAMAFEGAPLLLVCLMIFHSLSSWPSGIKRYANQYSWHLQRIPYKEALRITPQETYLRENFYSYGVARMIEYYVPKGERVLSMGTISDAYTTREILPSYTSAFSESLVDAINMGWIEDRQPRVLRTFRLAGVKTRRIRVVQTAQAKWPDQWSIHELRFYNHEGELPRLPQWRLRAWPNPWEVQLAFDNSPATRWRTWETAAPGDYIEVDFGQEQAVDEVRVETSRDDSPSYNFPIRMRVDVMDQNSRWVEAAGDATTAEVDPLANIRRAATYEMHARGVNYLLMSDTDYGADDIRDDPEIWGLKQIAAGYGARIYQVLP